MSTAARLRVVIADDHPRMLQTAAGILQERFEVVAAVDSGEAAVDAALRLQPDAVVLDVTMRGIDGLQAANLIRAGGLTAPIIFFSNHFDDEVVLAALARGGNAFVPKPRMRLDLIAAVELAHAGGTFVPSARLLRHIPRPAGKCHDLHLYNSESFLCDAVAEGFDEALLNGQSVLLISSEAHCALMDDRLKARGHDISGLTASRRYQCADASGALETFYRNGIVDETRFVDAMDTLVNAGLAAAESVPRHVVMAGAIAPLLLERGDIDSMLRVERLAHEYVSARPMSLLCLYGEKPLQAAPEQLRALSALHSVTVASDWPY
jgi:DNA-binding NarL/FixJ family response regulator